MLYVPSTQPMHYKIRKLLFSNRQPRITPVEYLDFCNELSSFLSHVHPLYVSVLYGVYCEKINNGLTSYINNVSELFNLTICSSNNQIFYIERGWSNADAILKVKERQSTNSINSIMKRKGVSKEQAQEILNNRSLQGITTKITNYGGIDLYKEAKKVIFETNKHNFYVQQSKILGKNVEETIKIIAQQNSKLGLQNRTNNPSYFPNTNIQFYLNKGLSLKEASDQLKNRQRTFSLDICIEKHGEEKGTDIWKQRQQKWFNTMDAKSDEEKTRILIAKINNGAFVSQESIRFFSPIIDNIPVDLTVFTGDNEFYINDHGKFWKYDFTVLELKLIIEYNGIHVHPKISSPDTWRHAFTKQSKHEVLLHDLSKRNAAINRGFTVIDVWSDDDFNEQQNYVLQLILTKYEELNK